MSWKKKYRSFYYQGAPEPEDIILNAAETALLVIDIQNKMSLLRAFLQINVYLQLSGVWRMKVSM